MSSNENNKNPLVIFLMLALALVSLVLLVVFTGFTIWFWIALVLWILFTLIFYLQLFAFFAITTATIWISFIIIFGLTITFIFVGGGDTGASKTGKTLVTCTSNGSDSPITINGWKGQIFSKTIDSNDNTDTGVRTFSIKNLDTKSGTSLYYKLEKTDGSNVTGAKGLIEVCDSNNMTKKYETTKDSTTTPASEGALAVYYYLHGNKRVTEPGAYRVDAWANVDGSWKLVDREVGVQFTQ